MVENNKIDLDEFYSSTSTDVWRTVLDSEMHYHHGIWEGDEDWAGALHNAVISLAQHVERGSSILDLGCGWGGPASVLEEVCDCSTLCVTISRAQASYCANRGLKTVHANLDDEIPEGNWSIGWWMESLEHLEQPEKALTALRSRCKKLVIRINTCETPSERLFGDSMQMQSTQFYLDALERIGWTVTHVSNRRSESLRSPREWLSRLKRVGFAPPEDPHLRALWDYAEFFAHSPSMYSNFPLMDIVAE